MYNLTELQGHNYPFRIQLIHEISMNNTFMFSKDMLITATDKSKKLVRVLLKYIEDKDIQLLKKTLTQKSNNAFNLLEKHLLKLSKLFNDIVEHEYSIFDPSLYHQIITNNSLTKTQLINFTTFITEKLNNKSLLETNNINETSKNIIDNITYSTHNIISLFCDTIKSITDLCNTVRLQNINTRIHITKYFLFINNLNVNIEQKYYSNLNLINTKNWIQNTKTKYGNNNLYTQTFREIIYQISISDNIDLLPEYLLLDRIRILDIIKHIKANIILQIVITLCKALINNLSLPDTIKNNIYNICLTIGWKNKIETYLREYTEDLLPVNFMICMDKSMATNYRSLRIVYTKRICNYISTIDTSLCQSLSDVSKYLHNVKLNTEKLILYNYKVFNYLFV